MTVTPLTLRKKIAFHLFRKYKENERKLHTLNYIFWEATLKCNLNCLHCGSDCKSESPVKDMPAKDFLKVIDQIRRITDPGSTMIVFTGGEALLRKDIEHIGLNLYQRGFPWGVVSNGMVLTAPRLDALLNSGLRSITISLDGLEGSHNWLRGNSLSFNRAIQAIKLLPKKKDLVFDVVTCVHRNNYGELAQIRDLLINLGITAWRIFTIFPIGRAKEHPQLQLAPHEFKGLFEFIRQTRKDKKIQVNYGCEGFLGNYEKEVRDNLFNCEAGINIGSILADGSISACPNLRGNFIQGNIYKDDFATIWETRFEKFRNRSWTKTGICSSCEFYCYCEGNGMHLHDEKSGDLLFCHLMRIQEAELPAV